MSRAKALWENPMGDVLVAVAIFIVVACCLVLALGRGPAPMPRPETPAAQAPAAPSEIPAPPSEVPAPPSEVPAKAPLDTDEAALPAGEAAAVIQEVEDEDEDRRSPTRRSPRAELFVNSWPASDVTVDGKKRGSTPLTLRLSAGKKHTLSLKSPRGEIFTYTRVLESNKKNTLIHRWKR